MNIASKFGTKVVAFVSAIILLITSVFNVVISNVIEEDEIPENECAMSFYLTKERDTLWEIAKELRVSPEMLMTQNPGLTDNMTAGTRVVVYRQRQVEF